ncbi:hypothetical protein Tco_1296980, partial [Tanacetum coccineum]
MNNNNVQGPPPAGPIPQNHGPPGLNLQNSAPDLRTMKELYQPMMNGWGRPISPMNIQATDFGLKIHMIQRLPNESLFEAWERYKLSIDRCSNHNMLPVTQIDTFYNGLTLRHRHTINATAGGTFMKMQPEECYDLIEIMTTHHNYWDTSAHRVLSSSSTTSSEIAALFQQMAKMRKYFQQMYHLNQQVNSVTPSC